MEEYGQLPLYAPQNVIRPHFQDHERRAKKLCTKTNLIDSQAGIQDFSDAFHISIGWSLEQPTLQVATAIQAAEDDDSFQNVKGINIKVEEIKVKVGNIVTNIFLPLKTTEREGFFGF